jgi:hypothetical protein
VKHLNSFNNHNWKEDFYTILEKKIQLGDNLNNKLSKMDDPLAKKMLDFLKSDSIKDDANASKVDYNKDDEKLLTLYDEKGKSRKFKFGKLLNYLGYDTKNIKPYEVENFINQFKKGDIERLKEVKGEDILDSYNCKNYTETSMVYDRGGLGVSCMRFDYAQRYLRIYTANPDVVSCLTYYDEVGKVQGRALIWTLDDGDRFMDRIYALEKEDYVHFYEYAEQNNISRDKSGLMHVQVDSSTYEAYPYMDTFQYYFPERGLLTNQDPRDWDDYEDEYSEDELLELINTNGSADEIGTANQVYSKHMDEHINKDEAVYSEDLGSWIYEHDAVLLYRKGQSPDWTVDNTSIAEITHASEDYEYEIVLDDKTLYANWEDLIETNDPNGDYGFGVVLIDDTKAWVEIGEYYYLNSEEVFLSTSDRKSTHIYATKDSYGKWHPHYNLISLWSDEDDEMMIVKENSDDAWNIRKRNKDYKNYVNLQLSSETKQNYIPEEFLDEDENEMPYVKDDAPIIIMKLGKEVKLFTKSRLEASGSVKIQNGYYVTEKFAEKRGVSINDNTRIYPPLSLSYYNSLQYDPDDIPMISSHNNPYKNYEDYVSRMKKLYVYFKEFKKENEHVDEDDGSELGYKYEHMKWALEDFYYFEKTKEMGESLEKYLMSKFESKTDTSFISYLEDSTEEVEDYVNNHEENFSAPSISGRSQRYTYAHDDRYFELGKQANSYISFMGLYYDTPNYKVFPYFYADKTDKYVVYRKETDKIGGYEMKSLEEIKGL